MKINEVEQLVGITKKNIRFYEEQGLICPKRQAENGYRNYSEADVEMLWKVKLLRKLAVPIEEIRKLQDNRQTLSDCLKRHEITLNREEENIRQTRQICQELVESGVDYNHMPTVELLKYMEEKEKGGTRFLNISVLDKKTRKKIAPLLATILVLLFMGFLIGMFFYMNTIEPIPWPAFWMILLIPAAVIVGVILAFRERVKEIEKGEEDAASNY